LRTQVIIIGAGSAGLLLGQLLFKSGIDNIIIERQSAEHVLGRIRAGVLESTTTDLMHEAGVASRMLQEGLVHEGFDLMFDNERLHIDLKTLTGGKTVTVYGQTELTRDLMQARATAGLITIYEATHVHIHDFAQDQPSATYVINGTEQRITGDFIAGCDGFHGVCRASIPKSAIQSFERVYPFGWLGLLANTPPLQDELLYGHSPEGFFLCSMRSKTRSRYYLQCTLAENVHEWSDERFWKTLRSRLPETLKDALITGDSIEKSIAPLRSFVAEPMRFGRLFLAGDAAHIVPPTGAKGLNLAASDVRYLSRALIQYFRFNSTEGIDQYSQKALARVWKAERFSWWMSMILHNIPDHTPFDKKLQRTEFDYLSSSKTAQQVLAENYVGLLTDDQE
jgi:p-hydroxybenzoate 3-monooxygenase